MRIITFCAVSSLMASLALFGCGGEGDADAEEKLVLISPHNQSIQEEFERAFKDYYREQTGRGVALEWRDVGGGGSKILNYLRNAYSRADSVGIDIVWGGGDYYFEKMAEEDILQPLEIPAEAKEQIPPTFGGLRMYDPQNRWVGAAMGGFGMLYNKTLLERLGIEPPSKWDHLADKRFHGLIALADPTKSSSAATAYEMIVQSAPDWPSGWAKLISVLGNAKQFYDGASAAADAVISEAPVATCIDFYGTMRQAKYPDDLVYVSPKGQTAFNADPIAILKNAPHPETAQTIVDFVLSVEGQALWAVRPGEEGGPGDEALGRQPIREDVYETYAGKLSPWVINPYAAGNEMDLDVAMRNIRFGVLRSLVQAAAVDNTDALQTAKKTVIDSGFDAAQVALFTELPPNVRTREQIADLAEPMKDKAKKEQLLRGWRAFFADQFAKLK